ncbi:cupin domain-containing protein [Flammeovirga yaeyamensis]|uniref:Cupin domain-containing protein n=1 Tax=Flammeovirga yaeyamensis TaxID=367791 RepID=A0AAX1MYQ5_9BACT|nr:cupin domain-containing protein [Flammeovirga yaeyamensis]MBB3696108.1 hypothetical protein [Flammeovirga yaeyamensis]NMF34793.1 cupin domain-containing protein [Flammeovirga yaeyamensis]QWG00379.1 cupin domain-containing protein [Flammeovirga yaeyamensis]
MTKEEIIDKLEMMPHPEGGYYIETYRSHKTALINKNDIERNISTAIYYLLGEGDFSTFHRLKFTELWHFHYGCPAEIVEITPNGEVIKTVIGVDILNGQVPQYIIKGGNWFAAKPLTKSAEDYVLVGCTVAPGFEFEDFEIGIAEELIKEFPQHEELILSFKK